MDKKRLILLIILLLAIVLIVLGVKGNVFKENRQNMELRSSGDDLLKQACSFHKLHQYLAKPHPK